MPQLVSELNLPYLDIDGAGAPGGHRRHRGGTVRALAGPHRPGLRGDPPAGRHRHPARPALPLGAVHDRAVPELEGSHVSATGERESILTMEGEGHARLRRLVAPAFTPAVGQPAPAHHAGGGRRAGGPDRRPGRVRAGGRRLRALPDPHHLRAPRRAARGLEAVLRLGHRHLPHLQQQPGRGPAAHRAGGRGAHRLRERHDRRSAGPTHATTS